MDDSQRHPTMKTSKLPFVVMLFLLGTIPLSAQTQRIWYGKHRVHPTRLLALSTNAIAASARMQSLGSVSALQNIAAQVSEKVTRQFPLVPGLVVLEPIAPAPTLTVPGAAKKSSGDLKERIRALMATGAFKYVEPDYELTTTLTPSDARFTDGTLWGLKNTGSSGGVVGADINAEAAWNITTGSPSVIVAVIDSGIRYTHQDLATQMWTNPGEVAGNGIDDDGNGYIDDVHGINSITGTGDPMDDNDHGTHCAGTIGAAANSGGPHVGVAWNVRLMACKFLDANGSGSTSDAIECINYAVAKNARVLNNSWGGGPFQQALFDAIANARNAGVLFVAAAGNGGADGVGDNNDTTPSYPASYAVDNVISVAAVNRADQLANFSNFGATSVHLGAPGVSILSSTSGSDSEYQLFDGTSMATPHVSGVAALVLAQFPGISLSELRQRILQGAVPIAALTGKTQTGGRLNALNALNVSGDNKLELSVFSSAGTSVAAGSVIPIFVKVTDFTNINNATVNGTIPAVGSLSFLNNGVAPDAATGDGIYSANFTVPASGTSFTLTMIATAAGKTAATNVTVFSIRQAPPNDTFANAIVIPGTGGTFVGTNINATLQSLEPSACGAGGGKTVWWRWTAPTSQFTTITTVGSDFDTVLSVYTGTAVNALTEIGCNDDVPGGVYSSEVTFSAVAGTTYRIAVDGYSGAEGNIVLNLAATPLATNNNFANRTSIPRLNEFLRGANFGATLEALESSPCYTTIGASVWWTWIAPSNMPVSVTTVGSSFDTAISVYTGTSLTALSLVGCNDDRIDFEVLASEVSFNAVGGTAYQFQVDGIGNSGRGNVAIGVFSNPKNDNFAARIPLVGPFVATNGYNLRATMENFEPNHAFAYGEQSVWWTWTAPASGNVSVSTRGSGFDTAMGIYTGNTVSGLALVTDNDDEAPPAIRTSKATFAASAGTTYHIAVDGYMFADAFGDPVGTDAGPIQLALSLDGKSRLDDFKLRSDGHYEFVLRGDSGRKYQIETTTALGSAWTVIGEFVLNGPSSIFVDPNAAGTGNRFYRAALAPLID